MAKQPTLGKAYLVKAITTKTALTKDQASHVLDIIFDALAIAFEQGNPVRFPRLGTFKTQKYDARMGRNLRTGEPCLIPARIRTRFTAGQKLLQRLNRTAAS